MGQTMPPLTGFNGGRSRPRLRLRQQCMGQRGPVSRKAEAVLRTLKTNRLQPSVPPLEGQGRNAARNLVFVFPIFYTQETPSTDHPSNRAKQLDNKGV